MDTVSDAGAKTVWRGSLNALIDDVQAVLARATDPIHALKAAWVGYVTLVSHAADIVAENPDDGLTVVQVVAECLPRFAIVCAALYLKDEYDERAAEGIAEGVSLVEFIHGALEPFAVFSYSKFGAVRDALSTGKYALLFPGRVESSNSFVYSCTPGALTERRLYELLQELSQPAAE